MSIFILFWVKILRTNQIQEIFLSDQIICLCNKKIQNLVLSQ